MNWKPIAVATLFGFTGCAYDPPVHETAMPESPDTTGLPTVPVRFEETLIEVDKSVDPKSLFWFYTSPDGSRLAYVAYYAEAPMRWTTRLFIDGVETKRRDDKSGAPPESVFFTKRLFFSSDNRFAYEAAVNAWFDVPAFPEGAGPAVWRGGSRLMVIDGEEGERFDNIAGFRFLGSDSTPAYVADRGGTIYLVRNGNRVRGVPGRLAAEGHLPIVVWSPAEDRVACVVECLKCSGQFVLSYGVDSEEMSRSQCYDRVDAPTFSPSGQRLAFAAKGGISPTPYPLGTENQFFSAVVVDGREGKKYQSVTRLIFSADGTKLVYLGEGRDPFDWQGRKAFFVVVNGKEETFYTGYDSVQPCTFTPEGQLLCVAHKNSRSYPLTFAAFAEEPVVLIDGKETESYSGVSSSPSGRRLAYRGSDDDNKDFVVVDGKVGKKVDSVYGNVEFLGDREFVAHVASINDGLVFVVEGQWSRKYETYFPGPPHARTTFTPRSDGRGLFAFAQRDGQYFRINVEVVGR